LPYKRDGPAPQGTAPSQGQKDERAVLLPRPGFLRNSSARTATPRSHPRSRRRQEGSWRGFSVRLYAPPTTDGAHALYAFLKLAAQRYGLEVGDVQEIYDPSQHND
jgi:hypothetical protein